jgi:tRNA(fMet)-specific endonuclease VapC
VKYLLDTDHLSILQRQSGVEFVALCSHLARHPPADIALCYISFHEQILGCNTYIKRAKKSSDIVRGYGMLERLLSDFASAQVLPFDSAAAAVFDGLVTARAYRDNGPANCVGRTFARTDSRDRQFKGLQPGSRIDA